MNKLISWTFGSIFRTLGRIIAYIIIAIIAVMIFNAGGFKKPKISNILNDIFFMQVNAETFENGVGIVVWYQDGGLTTPYSFDDIYYYKNLGSATSNGASPNLTRFFTNFNVSNIRGGRFEAPFLFATTQVTANWNTTNTQDYCTQWDYRVLTTQENVLSWDCQKFDSNSITNNDHEYITPTVNLAVYVVYDDGNITYCNIMNDRNTISCPVPNKATTNYVSQVVISSYVRYTGTSSYSYKVGLTNYFNTYSSDSNNIINNQNQNNQAIINNQNQNNQAIINNQNQTTQEIINNQNQQTQAINNTITDESSPTNISNLSNDNMVGWLPPGPVDSLINLPLLLLNSLQNSLSSTCSPITLTLPFINQDIYLPCMSSLYEEMGVSSFVNWAGIVASAFILFSYLLRFYKWVDNTLTFRENNWLDNWGGE